MNIQRCFVYAFFLGTLCLVGCEKSCSKKLTEPKTSERAPTLEKKAELISSFPDLDVSGLSEMHLKSLIKFLNEEICPCGCPTTFAQCLQTAGCKPGLMLAKWGVQQLKEGAPEHYLFKAMSDEVNAGYIAQAKTLSLLDAHHKGNPKAEIVIVEFADFECPACKMAASEMKEFMKGRDDVVLYFMHFPLTVHPNAQAAAVAAEAAGLQGKFWDLHDLMFTHQGPLTPDVIKGLAKQIFPVPKKLAQFERDLSNKKLLEKVQAHKAYGLDELKLMATPTFLWNGRPYNLSSNKEGYRLRLDMEKARKDIQCHK